ncbi:hypothetical protein RHRU231_650007 [Rhodococcus ruber]|uniref:Uncharacterized protein n=1 Tax=Rhodococcus ruber TaxID=1830 RepID=A0A098BN49_9NOCA|nr:hypothetical protein RHRU231_650007 [Rhodococcus ruber]
MRGLVPHVRPRWRSPERPGHHIEVTREEAPAYAPPRDVNGLENCRGRTPRRCVTAIAPAATHAFKMSARGLLRVGMTVSERPKSRQRPRRTRDTRELHARQVRLGDSACCEPLDRIDLHPVRIRGFEMQMRAGGLTSVSDGGDLLAGLHLLADRDQGLVDVPVRGGRSVVVADLDP